MTFLSMIGMVALSGIVVNDSLILVDFYNAKRREGLDLVELFFTETRLEALRPRDLTTAEREGALGLALASGVCIDCLPSGNCH
ncbi:MAG: efflux RND transporter permease subunit [Gemmatimonadetes bacterium]|nr:efflux RND transporter permease subunit [Gemmatimonadota bacterium]